jgi:hypothetical protein
MDTLMTLPVNQDDAKLAAQIKCAMKALDAADATRKEKAVAAGRLLLEAQKRHPTDNAFEKFLELAGGVRIRRAPASLITRQMRVTVEINLALWGTILCAAMQTGQRFLVY